MTIKQQGGVFGRNPSFNDVNIDTLTVDSSASVNGPLDCDGFTSNGQSNFVGTLGTVFVDSQGAFLNFTRNSGNYIRTTGLSSSLFLNTALKNRLGILSTGDVSLYKDDGVTVGATWDASAGNLAFASGNGIDFSATSGTGTSELFDDYEEGQAGGITLTAGTSGSFTMNTALDTLAYTKVGRMVSITGMISLTNASATGTFVELNGLPFAAADLGETSGRFVGMAFFDGSVGSPSVIGFGLEGWTKVRFVIDASTVTGNLFVNINYIAA